MTITPLFPHRRKSVAVIGAGISGLGAAWALRDVHDVTLFEKRERLGGHANTVDIDYDGNQIAVDTGFIVYNPLNYPNLIALFDHLGVPSKQTDMSFGFSLGGDVEWCSNGLGGIFAQKRNLARPSFIAMLRDLLRFNRQAPADLEAGHLRGITLGAYLALRGFSDRFLRNYLLPMGAAIWSATEDDMRDYPAESFIRFFRNHRLMHLDRPQWRTVEGGSRAYVQRIAADLEGRVRLADPAKAVRRVPGGAEVQTTDGWQHFDEVILACHSDQARALLTDMDDDEAALLGAIRYSPNTAILHRDPSLMPSRRAAHAAWNYVRDDAGSAPCVTYDMNRLQGIDRRYRLYVTLNPDRKPDPSLTFGEFQYDHPQFTTAAMAAQRTFNRIQGPRQTWFAGAWLGYGFHEDGLRSGLRIALRLGGRIPWDFAEGDVDGGQWGSRQTETALPAARTAAE
ncbi:NAD(P)/FAD-dependent oxidoreductase [Hyphobacterium marinum]|uniref:FAD-dependent oxidoreductase n=1 Tax=Hyphobacterium marinum TaxID=3116574 RepID=A0ABU7LYK3_9PROT|nr:FAD-dependent oxidoreductase [Hyphobacterium sp. Y6023]MEE2566636.1 FAD-dependent oxidoreductase [Hyphobacterium sp. Y6023]